MRNLRLRLAYDGTNYVGWQRQANGLAVQQVVEDAFAPLVPEAPAPPVVHGAGRTDAGVHALGQVASVRLDVDHSADAVLRALNVRLPPDIRVLEVADTDPAFHARFDARGKCYRYRLSTARILSPFDRWYVWHAPGRCDVDLMRQSAEILVGRHDFASFQARGSEKVDTVRTIRSIGVEARVDEIWVEIDGDGFLRHMVRAIVGSLFEVGVGTRPPVWLGEALRARDRRRGGATAPASGLTLLDVRY
jgi:tRNA pseudouridine38-40 synthase